MSANNTDRIDTMHPIAVTIRTDAAIRIQFKTLSPDVIFEYVLDICRACKNPTKIILDVSGADRFTSHDLAAIMQCVVDLKNSHGHEFELHGRPAHIELCYTANVQSMFKLKTIEGYL